MITLPDELLAQIFSIYIDFHGLYHSPANLLRINRRIHNVAISTYSLWSSIKIYLYSAQEIQQALASTGLEAYLQRSEQLPHKTVPLDISISWPLLDPYDSTTYQMAYLMMSLGTHKPPGHLPSPLQMLFQKLLWTLGGRPEYSPRDTPLRQKRWRSLQINHGPPTVGFLHQSISLTLPVYVFADLQILECRGVHIQTSRSTAPNLKQLTLRQSTGLTELQMPKVEKLRIEDAMEESELVKWYQRLPALKTLEIFSSSVEIPSPQVVPRLSTLILHSRTTEQQFCRFNPFTQYSPLDTLILYDMSPGTIATLLFKTPYFHFKTLKITAERSWVSRLEAIRRGISKRGRTFDAEYYTVRALLDVVSSRGATLEFLPEPYIKDGASVRLAYPCRDTY